MLKRDSTEGSKKAISGWKKYRNLIEWVVILLIGLVLYTTGWHTEVLGRLQQAVLWTGIMQPDTEMPLAEQEQVDNDFELVTLNGDQTGLAAFKGKVVFLNFWATWCPPCIAEMPNIQSLYEEYKDDNQIAFVMVSLDEDPAKAQAFIERKEFSFPVYFPGGPRPASLQSATIPTTFIIDGNGKIVTSRKGMAQYNTDRFKAFLDRQLAATSKFY